MKKYMKFAKVNSHELGQKRWNTKKVAAKISWFTVVSRDSVRSSVRRDTWFTDFEMNELKDIKCINSQFVLKDICLIAVSMPAGETNFSVHSCFFQQFILTN